MRIPGAGPRNSFDSAKSMVTQAIRAKEAGNIDEARDLFKKAAALEPNNPAPIHAWAMMEKQEGHYDEARILFEESIKRNGADCYGYLSLAIMEDELECYDVAREWFKKALKYQPNQIAPMQAYALFELEQGNLPAALWYAEEAHRLFPDNHYALYARGKVYRALGRSDDAYEDFYDARYVLESLIERHPYDTQLYTHLGKVLLMLREYEEAEKLYVKLMTTAPENTRQYAHKQMGELYEEQGDIDRAIREYRKALLISPGYLLAKKCLKRALQKKQG